MMPVPTIDRGPHAPRMRPRSLPDRRAPWRRVAALAVVALATVGAATASAHAARGQDPVAPAAAAPTTRDSAAPVGSVPWGVGERLTYDVKFGVIRAGNATLEIPEITDVRGRPAYHIVFRLSGGALFYHVNDTYESWIDTQTLSSLRFYQTQLEGGKTRNKRYEIFPDRRTYKDGDNDEEPSVADPLDDGSFLYMVRTLPLRTGDAYEFNRYFKPDRNPVRIRVVRRERIKVPAGTFDALVVQPSIKTKGIFAEGGRAEVWLSDDAERVILQVRTSLKFGSITMQLRDRRSGRAAGT